MHMKIDDELWNAIIAETQAGIERWNASAAKHGTRDRFTFTCKPLPEYVLPTTEHHVEGGWHIDRKATARKIATGEMYSCRLKRARNTKDERITAVTFKPAPRKWAKLAGKSPREIVPGLGLTDFLMAISSQMTGEATRVGFTTSNT
jgi:hypothetical protein